MFHPWLILLRVIGRHAMVGVGILAVLVAPVSISCLPCVGTVDAATVAVNGNVVVVSDAGLGDPEDPEPCDHCHCTAPAAIVSDHSLHLPVMLVGRNAVRIASTQVPDDPVFVPDPPPNRA